MYLFDVQHLLDVFDAAIISSMKRDEFFDLTKFFIGFLLFFLEFFELLIQLLMIGSQFVILECVVKEIFGKDDFLDCLICVRSGVYVAIVLPI